MKLIINILDSHNLPTPQERKEKKIFCLNENVYGCSKRLKKLFNKKINYSNYPDDNCLELRKKNCF